MSFIQDLFMAPSVTQSIVLLTMVVCVGLWAGEHLRIKSFSLGITWILFVGILLSSLGVTIDPTVASFAKNFGLILFVYSIGLQMGPSFAPLGKSGLRLNILAAVIVLLGCACTIGLHYLTGVDMATMAGIMSGAVMNTPSLGAVQQAAADIYGSVSPDIAMGYAVAYPLGVVGVILSLVAIRFMTRVDFAEENKALEAMRAEQTNVVRFSVEFTNGALEGHTVAHLRELINRSFVISRIMHEDGEITIADATSRLKLGEKLRVISSPEDQEAVLAFLGQQVEMSKEEWGAGSDSHTQLVSRRIVITKPEINGKKFSDLRLRSRYGINITRVNRAGIDLIPYQGMELQMGDRVMVVGNETAIEQVADVLGNSMKKLREPQLLTIFLGIALGVLFGSMPLMNIPQPVKLGLAGGPLIVAILIGRFGPHYGLVTYTTMSANLMLREVGLAMFLAGVGIGAGEGFVEAIVDGGYRWIGYGFIITVLPVLIVGLFARLKLKMNFYTLMGLLAGSSTNPPALGYANSTAGNDMPALGYATVYPVVMFLRVLVAQMLILMVM